MVKIEEEPHWHLPAEDGLTEIELVANYHSNDETVPLTIIQGGESIWLSRGQAEALLSFIQEQVLIR